MLSGLFCEALGQRKAMMVIVAPIVIAFIMLGFAESFAVVCVAFLLLSFIFGLNDAPVSVYISEAR